MKHHPIFLTLFFCLVQFAWASSTLAGTLFCNGLKIYVTSDGIDLDLSGENKEFKNIKRLSSAPKFKLSASVYEKEKRGWCDCEFNYELHKEIAVFFDRNGALEASYRISNYKSKALPVTKHDWLQGMKSRCKFQSMNYDYNDSSFVAKLYGETEFISPITELKKSFKPSHTCESPFDFEIDAKEHFGTYWEELRIRDNDLIPFKETINYCSEVCSRHIEDGFVFCSKTDFP